MKHNDAVTRLVEHGIKPSVQRIQIMHYLMTHFTHPTVEEVHKALLPKVPTLSRTTVYNLLQLYVPLHEDTSGSVLRNNTYILIHL